MGGQRIDTSRRSKNVRRNLLPERCVGDMGVEDVVHGHRVRRDGTAGINEKRATLLGDPPPAVVAGYDILPSDLADVVRAVTGGLEIDDTDSG